MTKQHMLRHCGWCEKPIYYGQYCSNECGNAHYKQWLEAASKDEYQDGDHIPNKREMKENHR